MSSATHADPTFAPSQTPATAAPVTDNPPVVFLTPKQVAKKIGVSANLVYDLLREGVIPAIQLHAKWLVRQDRLDAWLASCEAGEMPRRKHKK